MKLPHLLDKRRALFPFRERVGQMSSKHDFPPTFFFFQFLFVVALLRMDNMVYLELVINRWGGDSQRGNKDALYIYKI